MIVQCMGCKEEIDINLKQMVEVRRDSLCIDCFKKAYRHEVCCNNCQQLYSDSDDFVEVNGVVYCLACGIADFEMEE